MNLLINPKSPSPLRQKSTDPIPLKTLFNEIGDAAVTALKLEIDNNSTIESKAVLQCEKCDKKPFFNHPGEERGRLCGDCKENGMVYIKKK